jgi:hypothetical protein
MPLTDDNGNKWKPYVMGYHTDEGFFSTIIYAVSAEHAQLIIEEVRHTAHYVGEPVTVSVKKRKPE